MESGGASSSICSREVVSKKSNKVINVLVVDNDASCLATMAAILKEFKYKVVTVRFASDALTMLRIKQDGFDLVITDSDMPDMNGFELLQAIAKEFKDLPIVLMSSDPGEGVVLKGLENGASYFILKPMCTDDVKDLWQFAAMKNKSYVTIREEIVNVPVPVSSSPKKNEGPATKKGKASQSGTWKKNARKIAWNNSLNDCFLEAIRIIGLHRTVPRKILEVMNFEGLTRENVASKLQKYRAFLWELSDASYKVQNSASHHNRTGENTFILRLKKFPFKQPVEQYFPAALGLFGESRLMLPNRGQPSTHSKAKQIPIQTKFNPFLVGNINYRIEGQLSYVVGDYRVMQPAPNRSPHFGDVGNIGGLNHESAYSPMFDIQHLEAFVNSLQPLGQGSFHTTFADQSMILNQPQNVGRPSGTSSFYGDIIYRDHISLSSFAYNQNLINRPQEVGASSSAQLINTIPSTPTSEPEEEEFLNSLFTDGDEDLTPGYNP